MKQLIIGFVKLKRRKLEGIRSLSEVEVVGKQNNC